MTAAVDCNFSVLTGNKYGFLGDDVEDPEEILRLAAEEKDKAPKPKNKKAKQEVKAAAAAQKAEEAKTQGRPDSSAADQNQARKNRRDRGNQQEGKNAIPRFNNDSEGGEQQQRPPSRGFGRGAPRGGFGSRPPRDEGQEGGAEDSANRGRGRGGRGGEMRGRGRGEGRGGFGRGGEGRGGFGRGGEGRGRGGRGFGPRSGDAERPAGEGEEHQHTEGGSFGGRGRGGFGRGGFGNRPEHSGESAEPAGEDDGVDGGHERSQGRGRGNFHRGRGSRGFGGGGFGRGRGREFERHSGAVATGVKPIDKRDGAGAHNWGTVKDDMEEQLQAPEAGASKDQDWAEAVEQEAAADGGAEQQPERMMTLEEWKRQKDEDRAKLSTSKAAEQSRKVDTSSFKDMTAYKKERLVDEDESEDDDELSTAHVIVKKPAIETNFSYNNPQTNYDDRRRGGGRGGRGGRGRGDFSRGAAERGGGRGRGRGGPSGGGGGGGSGGGGPPSSHAEFRVDDKDFPDLH